MDVMKPIPSEDADKAMACLYIIATVIGIPFNLIAIWYFLTQRKEIRKSHPLNIYQHRTRIFNLIYLFIVSNDLVILTSTFPVIEGFLTQRHPYIFSVHDFCTIWGMIWNIVPFFSVFLVLVLSVIRTVTLLYPKLHIRYSAVLATIYIYLGLLIARATVWVFIPGAEYTYSRSDQYCWEERGNGMYESVQLTIAIFFLALPLLPIISSCMLTLRVILHRKSNRVNRVALQRKATITIILVTLIYIVFNFPIILNYVYYTRFRLRHLPMSEGYTTNFMYNYSWNVSYILCIVLNACSNPFVYLTRIEPYRSEVLRTGRVVHNSVIVNLRTTSMSLEKRVSGYLDTPN